MTVVRGAAARRLAVRTHALHLQPPRPGPRAPATSSVAAQAALPSTYQRSPPGSRDGRGRNAESPGATSEPWSAVLEVETGTSLRHARAFVRNQLRDHGHAARNNDVTLVAVELVTNALAHSSARTVTLRLSSPSDGVLLLEVTDPDPSCPALSARSNGQGAIRDAGTASAAAGGESGRGLDIVGLLSRWGVNEHPGGKTVWALFTQSTGEGSDHDPFEGQVPAPTPSAAVVTVGPAAAAESRPGQLGAVHWTLACSARQLRVAGGLPPLQRQELSELLLLWHRVTDTGRVLDSVTRVTAALGGTGSGGSWRLSGTTGHLLVELAGPESTSPPSDSDRSDAARLAGAHSAGRHRTCGEARGRQVHWAAIALPERRPLPAGTVTPAATPTAEPGDDWA